MKKIFLALILCFISISCYANAIIKEDYLENIREFKKFFDTLNIAISMSEHTQDNISFNERTTSDIINKSFLPHINISSTLSNGFVTKNNWIVTFKELNEKCGNPPIVSDPSYNTACAEITVDINGIKFPNKYTTDLNNPNDKFKVLLYSNEVVLIPNSIEEKLVQLIDINGIELYSIKPLILTEIYNRNKNKTKFAIEIKFYNNKNEQVYSKVISGEAEPQKHTPVYYEIDYNELPKGTTSYKINLVEVL